jgi:hypothetical protein
MRTFVFYMEDDRYTVPHVIFVSAVNADRAMELAGRELLKSRHHLSVEVREDDALCYRLGRGGEEFYPRALEA